PQHAHALVERLLHLRKLRLQVLHLRLQLDDLPVHTPGGSACEASSHGSKKNEIAKRFHVSSWCRTELRCGKKASSKCTRSPVWGQVHARTNHLRAWCMSEGFRSNSANSNRDAAP